PPLLFQSPALAAVDLEPLAAAGFAADAGLAADLPLAALLLKPGVLLDALLGVTFSIRFSSKAVGLGFLLTRFGGAEAPSSELDLATILYISVCSSGVSSRHSPTGMPLMLTFIMRTRSSL